MLEIKSLCAQAGTFLLNDVNLDVAMGKCHAVLGPSGSGKSTLLHSILGLLPVTSGRILLQGDDITRLPIERRGLGYVPQQIGLFPHLTVRDNIAYSARARGVPQRDIQPMIDKLVDATGIGALIDRHPPTLSGGERQRVGLVRALASRPRLVLLDEPFTALNTSLRRELWFLMRGLQRDLQITILLVTHDLTEAYFLADHITILMDGRVLQQGDKAKVFAYPAAAEVAGFLGVETIQAGRIEQLKEGMASVRVGTVHLTAPAPARLESNDVLVSIRSEDVTLSLSPSDPMRGSVRNHLPARILSILPGSPLVSVELDAGFPLTAVITRSSCESMCLAPNMMVTAQIKAAAIHLIPAPGVLSLCN